MENEQINDYHGRTGRPSSKQIIEENEKKIYQQQTEIYSNLKEIFYKYDLVGLKQILKKLREKAEKQKQQKNKKQDSTQANTLEDNYEEFYQNLQQHDNDYQYVQEVSKHLQI
ncbi:hypothetical protein PPERSA_07419 [Pseudocohnilembus persalinus]|uniref:Uncharacterized protein n=1 Tax=Pseudocohnilembus persalinus TaxID=266149 RepID=A0A0V0QAD9_PSEPJ|nr:hypothetical protein PPERSA_07419 [Pseudocohnilembus persalinus]|eukprot:KRW99176.1 hypothetical protein PPERSA_07419 [Pseudocohnilembus persalinus]